MVLSKQVSYRYHDKRKSPINGLFTPFMKLCLLFKLFPREVSSNQKCWFYAAFHRIYFIKCYSFHIIFKNFSSKLVAIIPCCFYEIHGRYNLLLLLKTNNIPYYLWFFQFHDNSRMTFIFFYPFFKLPEFIWCRLFIIIQKICIRFNKTLHTIFLPAW